MPRFHCAAPLATGTRVELPPGPARHVQVLRMQPGQTLTLFGDDAAGGSFEASIESMGRSDVVVRIGAYQPDDPRAAQRPVHLALGMPANDRMDWLVEKATELGMASLQPLITERSVLRLAGERAEKKIAHWRGVAVAACEQSGRNHVPQVFEVKSLAEWLRGLPPAQGQARGLLSLRPGTRQLSSFEGDDGAVQFLSGPEGGLSPAEEDAAIACGFTPVTLGPRTLRAETAPLAVLARLLC
ncbi:16S rRNA (uracil(1498)-N(3))-methyltransferase [Rhodoferax koreense]|uniref:Ribosomal RNA small subunit methyltransferase E n=1 Tax=Rhodoferax koreensis TaxID=1842727 RepID=A0A1P8K2V5_9BURK|nr:16S rRNA (uracil(1498)-N(3))-methyltransferase [Rhodoferax koreense]APW40326.1 16S rRNA (uracil(1498)-N(3))-methyltransferase [Rhodoferax koreense]